MAVHASVRARRLLAWGQKQSLPKLFDHLIGAGEERRRHFQIKRSRRDRIEDKLKLILLFDRDVSRLGAAQNFIHVIGGAPAPPTAKTIGIVVVAALAAAAALFANAAMIATLRRTRSPASA